jgi:hypothetical protein
MTEALKQSGLGAEIPVSMPYRSRLGVAGTQITRPVKRSGTPLNVAAHELGFRQRFEEQSPDLLFLARLAEGDRQASRRSCGLADRQVSGRHVSEGDHASQWVTRFGGGTQRMSRKAERIKKTTLKVAKTGLMER